ncbi:MAG: hypothetical protein K2W95_22810 [Candidatus Obscuribacterales bacterium]|nr:hypothetical protein [Candidatus Obscuribacterales bacterium]
MSQVLSVGTVTYNNSPEQIEHLLISLDAAAEQLNKDLGYKTRLHTIDNGNDSAIDVQCAAHRFHSFTLHKNPPQGNTGFASSTNLLMTAAFKSFDCHAFVTINPDGVLARDCLSRMLARQLAEGNAIVEGRQFPEEHPKEYEPSTGKTSWTSGACLLLPRNVYESLHGFDPGFFMYMEDVDLAWRARARGVKTLLCDDALFGHPVVGRTNTRTALEQQFRSALYLGQKWQSKTFVEWVKAEMLKQGLTTPGELAALTVANETKLTAPEWQKWMPSEPGTEETSTDFEHFFAFAVTRWT